MKHDTKRLFFALWPDEAVRGQLHALGKTQNLAAGRPVHRADLHITLQYLGQTGPDQRHCAEIAASRAVGDAFSLSISQVHYWKRSRVLWAGLENTPDALQRLVIELAQQLQLCGIEPEHRVYQPHITLARNIPAIVGSQAVDRISWNIREFVLLESHTDGRIPRYEIVARFSLG